MWGRQGQGTRKMNPINDFEFDRLVDGELVADERRRLLASLDDRPDGWRQCALAFLEAQSWRADLGEVANEAQPAAPLARPASTTIAAGLSPRQSGYWLALAAGVLVAFGLGWASRPAMPTAPGAANNSTFQIAGGPSTLPPESLPAQRSEDALTLLVRDEHGDMQPFQVPLVDAGQLDEELGMEFRSGIPQALRERFQKHGYSVQSRRRYAPMWLENGRPLVVPVEDTRIVPIGASVQ
jgi:hypothetical protein